MEMTGNSNGNGGLNSKEQQPKAPGRPSPNSASTNSLLPPIIIFHPGSKYLRFGKSSCSSPKTVLHAIGRRRKVQQGINTLRKDDLLPDDECGSRNSQKPPPEVESARLQLCYTLQTTLRSDGRSRFATPTQTIAGYNSLSKGEVQESETQHGPQQVWEEFTGRGMICGDEIFKVNPDGDFNIHFPWRRGQLNVHENIGGSLSSVIIDLYDIWSNCVSENLDIPLEDLKNYRALVVLPVMFDKNHAKEILNMVLNTMGFSTAFLIQDHVCASFGSGLSTALVVDVGDQKISVSCVEDGISIPQSRILLKYGGIDLTSALLHLMKQSGVPLPVNRRNIWDIEFVNKLKENLCHLNLDRCGPEEHLLIWDKPGASRVVFKIHFGDEVLIVPLSYFNPDLLRGSLGVKPVVTYRSQPYIADDPFDIAFINDTSRKVKESDDGDDEDIDNSKEDTAQPISKIDSHNLLGIVQAIIQSIDSSDCNEETKRRLYSCILFVGGGFKFHGFDSWLQNKLSTTVPRPFRSDVEVITQPKEIDPSLTTWKGAAILVQLETAVELWISREEWNKHGSRTANSAVLKCVFLARTMLNKMETENLDLFYLEKCAICEKPGSKACGACELEFYCSKEHQKQDWKRHKFKCCNYDIIEHEKHGFCMIATKLIPTGDLIASELPLTTYTAFEDTITNLERIFALSGAMAYPCPTCNVGKIFKETIHRCSKCDMPLCKIECEKSGLHQMECAALQKAGITVSKTASVQDILTDVAVLRVFLKEEKKGSPITFENRKWNGLLKIIFAEKLNGDHGDETEFSKCTLSDDIVASLHAVEKLSLSIKVTGSKELVILLHCALTSYGAAFPYIDSKTMFLFTKNHRLSHSCFPNAEMWVENKDGNNKLIIKAVRTIHPGHRITIDKGQDYTSLPTAARRQKLREMLDIECNCRRCNDPTEIGTFISAIRCEENLTPKSCVGHYVPQYPMRDRTKWKCTMKTCNSSKTFQEIQNMVKNLEEELPSVNGRADEVLKKLKSFNEYYAGDVLRSSHYLLRVSRSRARQVVKYFLGPSEKLLLCVLNNYPRAYEYCVILLNSADSLWLFTDIISAPFNVTRGLLLYEKSSTKLAIALYEFLVLRSIQSFQLIQMLEEILQTLADAVNSISIFTHSPAKSLRDDINFMVSVITKILKNPKFGSHVSSDIIEKNLNHAFFIWKSKSQEIGLISFYMEPTSSPIPIERLRNIISCI